MTILSDIDIFTLCADKYYVHHTRDRYGRKERHYLSQMDFNYVVTMRPEVLEEGELETVEGRPMITPFVGGQVKEVGGGLIDPPEDEPPRDPFDFEMRSHRAPMKKVLSYGLSSYGYDFRIAPEFRIFTNVKSTIVDPKNFDDNSFVEHHGESCIIPPNSFVLARTVERFCMPPDVTGICLGKSTIARTGINCLATPVEAGWEGYLTLEYANTTPLPAKLYANEGGLQILFFKGDRRCLTSYEDRKGKYSDQPAGIVTARV